MNICFNFIGDFIDKTGIMGGQERALYSLSNCSCLEMEGLP